LRYQRRANLPQHHIQRLASLAIPLRDRHVLRPGELTSSFPPSPAAAPMIEAIEGIAGGLGC
jgi:hypothetical protein